MPRLFWLLPLSLLTVIVTGMGICTILAVPMDRPAMLAAAAVSFAASGVALVPLVLVAGADAGAVSQAGLVGTVVHMFAVLALAALAWKAGLAGPQGGMTRFAVWLLGMYWATLGALVVITIKAVHVATGPGGQPAPDRAS